MGYLVELMLWARSLDPAAAFLFALPFMVATAGLVGSWFDDENPESRERDVD